MTPEAKIIIAVLAALLGTVSLAFIDMRADLRELRDVLAGQKVLVSEDHDRIQRLERCVLTCEP